MTAQASNREENLSYKAIFKATTLFGGVQLYQIVISIIRSKFIAVLLGTAGMGIQGLYQSTLQFIQSITSLGLSQSAVRDISEANGTGDMERISMTVSAFRKMVWFTGLLGMGAVMVLAPVLSKLTFGNYDFTIPLFILSSILLIEQLAAGQRVVLQGMRRLKDLAKSSAIGATLGLFISVPIYYYFGIRGIVPTLVLSSLIGLVIFWYFGRKITIPKLPLSIKDVWHHGQWMVKMGVAMSISGIFGTAISYIIRAFIMRQGGTEAVGLYQAGFVIINTYVGMVFSAIGTDFYPRLAAVNHDNAACRDVVSQQGEIAIQILAPLLCSCVLLMPVLLRILYSEQFINACPFVLWCCPGMMFRLASWLIAYQFVAKAESRLFMFTELIGSAIYTSLSLLGYHLGGLTGIGIAFTIDYLIYLIIVYIIASRRYNFCFTKAFASSFIIQSVLVAASLFVIISVSGPAKYWIGVTLMIASFVYALIMLEQKIGCISMIRGRLSKNGRQ